MPSAPYDTLQSILNVAIVRLNDAMKTPATAPAGQIGGEVIGAQQIYTLTGCNAAWRRFQADLVSQNYSKLINTVQLLGLTNVATTDPGTNCYIDWTGYFDGVTLQSSPVLPQDLLTPLRLKERVHGATGVNAEFTPMEYVANGLTGLTKGPRNFNWAWDNDRIIIPGSTNFMDLELRYSSFLADFTAFTDPVPIVRCM